MTLKLIRAAFRQWRLRRADPFPKGFDLFAATEDYVAKLVTAGLPEDEARTAVNRLWRLVATRHLPFDQVQGLVGSRISIEESLALLGGVREARAGYFLGQL